MNGDKSDLVEYRMARAQEAIEDARILAGNDRWNAAINRLYYSAYYAVIALLINADKNPTTHNGVKTLFSQDFVKEGIISRDLGKAYSQLFTWRQKGDYDDFFDFNREIVEPYFDQVETLIRDISKLVARP